MLWDDVPQAWRDAADHVDATAGDGRAVVLPGQLYAYYDWGGTIDPILPAIADKPVATRNSVGYADLHAVDMLWTVDALVEQRRALPGQLDPLLDLLGARTVLAGADDDRTRSGAAPAAEAADVLDQLGSPDHQWGEERERPRAAGTLGPPRALPEVRAWDRPDAPGLVRVEPAEPRVVVDGSAEGVAALAAMEAASGAAEAGGAAGRGGALSARLRGDLSPAAIARAPEVVITDSNRRRVLVPSRMAQNAGPVLAASEEPSIDAAVLNPFPDRGSDGQTVAVYDGIAAITAPSSPGFPQFPERRPFAAIDGDTETHWQADRALTQDRHTLEITFTEPRDIADAQAAAVQRSARHGHRGRGPGPPVRRQTGLEHARAGSARRAHASDPDRGRAQAGRPDGGRRRHPRAPGARRRGARGAAPARSGRARAPRGALTYLFQRTTGDDPFRRTHERGSARRRARARSARWRDRHHPRVQPARGTHAGRWMAGSPPPPPDLLTGVEGSFTSSAIFEGRPGFRASSAFDGTERPWIGAWLDGRQAWLSWTTERDETVSTLKLDPVPGVRRPTQVRLNDSPPVAVAPDGTVRLPQPVRGREFRLTILRAAFPPGTPGTTRQRRAVGIAEVRGGPTCACHAAARSTTPASRPGSR